MKRIISWLCLTTKSVLSTFTLHCLEKLIFKLKLSKCHCQATYLLIGWKVQLCLFIRKSSVHQFTRKYKFRLMIFYFLQKWFFVFAWWINNTRWNFLKEQAPPVYQVHFIYHFSVTCYEWWVIHIGFRLPSSVISKGWMF